MYEKEHEELNRLFPKLVARAWVDESFKKELLENPRKVIAENGLELPEDFPLNVVESDLPPADVEAVAQPLAAAAGAASTIIPPPPAGVGAQSLGSPLAGATSGTAGSAGSLGTVCGTGACFFSVGTAGTKGAAPETQQPPTLTAGTFMSFGPTTAQSQPGVQQQTAAASGDPLAQAGSTVGCAGTVGSVLCFCGSIGTIASGGTAGSR